ncbi:MAG: 50S ribosomal protein L15 [Candidatus Binatia bacterium]|nr:50S ribosomal protein L15 [Candidatus Binatia bacterium]MDG1958046.1 50S ribosomal protein L15 [Candidatus Binatia bacterium]MDG2011254.1 50S ribosomal protein L15 [Candidatus Binatia bacterium]HAC79460.1 50S ribosomal protein L15 [Deltaproteobacteria bacterium]
MDLSNLRPSAGSSKNRKRVGRGQGSGLGKTAGRGHKGSKSRAGGSTKVGYEGGQMPLHRRLPKRGFYNPFRTEYEVVNLSGLTAFEAGSVVDPAALRAAGLVRNTNMPVKILAKGSIDRKLTVKAQGFSGAARKAIEAQGGEVEVLA